MIELINFWKELDIRNLKNEQKPFVHPDDEAIFENNYTTINNYNDYINNPNFRPDDNKFHLNLIPIPYIGNIEDAKVYILMLNPGFGILDYFAESNEKVREALIYNLEQNKTILDSQYPFIFLNPEFLWHGGGQYWEKRLKDLIDEAQIPSKGPYVKKLSYIAKKIAVLQFIPYHSKSYHHLELKSSEIMLNFVKKELVKKAQDDKICIICPRGEKYWEKAADNKKIFVFPDKKQSRASYISKKTFEGNWEKIIGFLNES